MKISCRKIVLLLLFLGSGLSASSKTILIETRDSQPRESMDLSQRVSIVSAETGIMDSLFERGHIFFNIYTSGGNPADGKKDQVALKLARDEGASFLLVLIPDLTGISWTLYGVPDKQLLTAVFTPLDNTDPKLKIEERWLFLGSQLAAQVLVKLQRN